MENRFNALVSASSAEKMVCANPCRRGDMVNCQNPVTPGVTVDGGYAEVMIAEARGISSIPDELTSVEAAPLLCAGITTYNALRNAGLRGGDLVAVQGIVAWASWYPVRAADGIPYCRNRAWTREGKACERLGRARLHRYCRRGWRSGTAAYGGARAILATAPSGDAMGPLVQSCGPREAHRSGCTQDQIQLSAFPLVFGGRSIYGSLAGTAIETEDALAFSVLANIRPMIETVPLERLPMLTIA